MRKAIVAAFILVIATTVVVLAAGPGARSPEKPLPPNGGAEAIYRQIQYDPFTIEGHYPSGTNLAHGNMFTSAFLSPLLPAGTITQISFAGIFGGPGGAGCVSVWDLDPGAMSVALQRSWCAGPIPADALFAVIISQMVDADFFAAIAAGTPASWPAQPAFDNHTVCGQGWHAARATWNGPTTAMGCAGPCPPVPYSRAAQDLSRNLNIRVWGNMLVPIELLDFQVQ